MKGEGGGAAAAAAGWLAAAAVTAGSVCRLVSSQADFISAAGCWQYCMAVRVSLYRYGSTRIGFVLTTEV